jgi:ABC-2 type transport system ATP-binding protein
VAEGAPDALKAGLGGDSVQVVLELPQEARRAAEVLTSAYCGAAVDVDSTEVRIRVKDGAHEMPALLAALEAHGVAVVAATIARPSLDDVYLRHTGRSFRSAEEALRP